MRISDWSADVCSSYLKRHELHELSCEAAGSISGCRAKLHDFHRSSGYGTIVIHEAPADERAQPNGYSVPDHLLDVRARSDPAVSRRKSLDPRSEEHTSELQSLMRISYAVFCLKKKKITT